MRSPRSTAPWVLLLILSPASAGYGQTIPPSFSPVVEPEHLIVQLKPAADPAARPALLDVRPAEKFAAGHVKDAIPLDVADWTRRAKTAEEGLDHPDVWRRLIGELGLTSESNVIVYDGGAMTEAARIWFTLQHLGVQRAAILNGGYAALEPLLTPDLRATGSAPAPSASGAFAPKDRTPAVGLLDKSGVKEHVGRSDTVVLDVRTENEYLGTDKRGNPRAGHLPGAINLPHERLLDDRGRLKPPDALRQLFAEAGLKPGRRIVMHCQSGGRSSLAALAAVRAGFTDVANYYLSFADWSADESCPVVATETRPSPSSSPPGR